MKLYRALVVATSLLLLFSSRTSLGAPPTDEEKPNIVFILVDDAGIGDFSTYGCQYGVTPNIDQLANEGMKFTNAYSGNAVCGPSRCVLMTGLHPGHAQRRANQSKDGLLALPTGQMTVAKLLHEAGYATGGFGKWGLGNPGTTGVPEKQGFDTFFGYYDQRHAHDYYTEYLIRNSVRVPITQSGDQSWDDYSATRIADETIQFIEANKDRPFFCYAAWTPPHGAYEIPDNSPYGERSWTETEKNYAAMVALDDTDVGRVMQKLKDLGIDEKTLVVFTSDNGANANFIKRLGSTGQYRGYKRMLYEGGIRAPFIARWPGKIQPGSINDVQTTFVDVLPTIAELIGVPVPAGADGYSILPSLLGRERQVRPTPLYFEIYEPYFQQSVRLADWKGYRTGTRDALELYDLKADPGEANNVAEAHPDIIKEIEAIMTAEHTPSPHYTTPEHRRPAKAKRNKKRQTTSLKDLLDDKE
ncbi:arylsulfatase [Allorhodopirellula heiligendammensis]|uniref:Arylsulfatase n=1 Tax=Allorhodopirellula heiligendammensis TaxID=2714739 RepID=A0A5C6BFJ5_9BACT|nr:arylsulfatase [Allorhodopirellula heiligendammensis]TWU10913.1 Arylsulfatase precursor [Allorhodopirellula heiligendammensis]